jgi:hypothetical protein
MSKIVFALHFISKNYFRIGGNYGWVSRSRICVWVNGRGRLCTFGKASKDPEGKRRFR